MIPPILIALSLAQAPTPTTEEAPWIELDSAALIVNEDIITNVDVVNAVRRTLDAAASREERVRASDAIVTQRVQDLLEQQAGQVMGYEPRMVDRFVEDEIARQQEQAGSVVLLASALKARNLDSFAHRDEIRSYVYAMLWRRAQTGIDAGAKGRVSADRFVRPGRIHFEFEERKAQIAADPLLTVHAFGRKIGGAPDAAHDEIAELRSRMQEGADFDAVIAIATDDKVKPDVLVDRPLSSFRPSRAVWEYLRDAEPGTISQPIEFRVGGVLDSYLLLYLVERKARPEPSFSDPEMQRELRDARREDLDQARVAAGHEKLYHAAYVWPPEMLGRRATLEN